MRIILSDTASWRSGVKAAKPCIIYRPKRKKKQPAFQPWQTFKNSCGLTEADKVVSRTLSTNGYNPSKPSCSETAEKVSACGLVHTLLASLLPTHLWLANLPKLRACIPPATTTNQTPSSLLSPPTTALTSSWPSPPLYSPPLSLMFSHPSGGVWRIQTNDLRRQQSVKSERRTADPTNHRQHRASAEGRKKVSPSRHTHHRSRPPDS